MAERDEVHSLIHVGCAHCGAGLTIQENSHICRCDYCGSSSLLVGREGALQYYLPPQISSDQAQHYLRDKLRAVSPQAKISATLQDIQLYYVPFWRLHGNLLGWVLGREPVKRKETTTDYSSDGSTSVLRQKEKVVGDQAIEKLVRRAGTVTISACDITEMGVESLDSRHQAYSSYLGVHQRVFNDLRLLDLSTKADDGIFLDVTVPLEEARQDAHHFFQRLIEGSAYNIDVTYQTYRTIADRVSLIYYPIWFCRFAMKSRQFTATVDGQNGRILAGKVPDDPTIKILAIFALIVLVNLLLTPFIKIIYLTNGTFFDFAVPIIGVGLLALIGILYFAWISFSLKPDIPLAEQKEFANSPISMS